jgi:hypothetical protein
MIVFMQATRLGPLGDKHHHLGCMNSMVSGLWLCTCNPWFGNSHPTNVHVTENDGFPWVDKLLSSIVWNLTMTKTSVGWVPLFGWKNLQFVIRTDSYASHGAWFPIKCFTSLVLELHQQYWNHFRKKKPIHMSWNFFQHKSFLHVVNKASNTKKRLEPWNKEKWKETWNMKRVSWTQSPCHCIRFCLYLQETITRYDEQLRLYDYINFKW